LPDYLERGHFLDINTEQDYSNLLYMDIDQKLVNSLHGLMNCEIG